MIAPLNSIAGGPPPRAASARLDLVLVNPASRKRVYQSLGQELAAIEPPVWAGLMATYVRGKGCSAAIVDAEAEELSADETAARVADLNPLLAAVVVYGHQPSASTQIMPAARDVCAALKRLAPDRPVLMLGGHVAALPQRTLAEEAADFVSGGEGLVTLVDLVGALRAAGGGAIPPADLRNVHDLWFRDGAAAVASDKRAALVQDVDREMPAVAWDLLPMRRYRAHNWHCLGRVDGRGGLDRQPYVALYTTLGCPYKCSFCCIQAPFKSGEAQMGMRAAVNSYRYWSPKRVADELQRLVEQHGVRNVKFADEMFVLNKKHVEGVCDEIIARGLDLNIWAYARVDTVKEGMLEKLKRAGFHWLAFGIEAANVAVRKDVQKGFDQQDIFRTLKHVSEAGIYVIGNYIFGLPEDTYDTMRETLDLAVELNCEFGNFYSTMAYPGSPLYAQAVAGGWKLPETWGGYSQHSVDTLPLPTRHLSGPEVLAFRDKAFRTYYSHPNYLDMVGRKFGPATVGHLQDMLAKKLVRNHQPSPATAGARL